MKNLILPLILALALVSPARAQDWSQTAQAVRETVAETRRNAEETKLIIDREKALLSGEIKALKASATARQARFDTLKEQYAGLLEREARLNEELDAQAHELQTIDGTIRTSAKQARDYFHESQTTPEHPERNDVLAEVLRPEKFPGLEGIRNLLNLFLDEMDASGTGTRRQGTFIGTDGQDHEGELVRIGTFTTAFREADGTLGFLRPTADGTGLVAVKGEPGWALGSVMDDFFDGKGGVFPVDISNGAALSRLAQEQKSVWEWLSAGGLLVWPIILVGVIALGLVVERFYFLSRVRGNSDRNMKLILEMTAKGEWQQCRDFCKRKKEFPTCRIIGHTLQYLGNTREIIENAFQEGLLKELPMLERFLPTLGVLAAVAPLLGLLGTVTGMINTFQIITQYGTGDPRMMSGGISEALVTTQLGLAVAVPIMLLHHLLERRVDKIVADMEEKGTGFAVALMKKGQIVKREDLDAAA